PCVHRTTSGSFSASVACPKRLRALAGNAMALSGPASADGGLPLARSERRGANSRVRANNEPMRRIVAPYADGGPEAVGVRNQNVHVEGPVRTVPIWPHRGKEGQ